jgi:hypothetical protein
MGKIIPLAKALRVLAKKHKILINNGFNIDLETESKYGMHCAFFSFLLIIIHSNVESIENL